MRLFNDTEIGTIGDIRRRAPVIIRLDGKTLQGGIHLISQQVQAAADVQVDKTFDDDILVTSFGQKLLPMSLVCIALPANACSGASGGDSLAKLYRNNHAGKRRASGKVSRITVGFDGETFDGILTAISQVPHNLSDGASMDVFRYTLNIQGNFK